MAIEYRKNGVPAPSAREPDRKPIPPVEDKKQTPPKREKVGIALSGKKVMFQQRIDGAVVDAFKGLSGSPSENLTQAMIDFIKATEVVRLEK